MLIPLHHERIAQVGLTGELVSNLAHSAGCEAGFQFIALSSECRGCKLEAPSSLLALALTLALVAVGKPALNELMLWS